MHEHRRPDEVIPGVDTPLDTPVGVVIDYRGKRLGVLSIQTTLKGYQELLHGAQSLADLRRAGSEGTGAYGAGLTDFLYHPGVEVLDINRPDRSQRRFQGKADPTAAENAARWVLSGQAQAIPKRQKGAAEAMRILLVASRSAVKARTQTINPLPALLISAPDPIRNRLGQSKPERYLKNGAQLQTSGDSLSLKTLATPLPLRAKRGLYVTAELQALDKAWEDLTQPTAKRLRNPLGAGPPTAATRLTVAGDKPERLRTEAALAVLGGTHPLPASSGKTVRHRLNRSGDRAANKARWTISLVTMRSEPRTRAYVARRTAEGKSTKEIQRWLKRYLVREL